MNNEVKQELRTSFYLTRKAEALLGALRFFRAPSSPLHRHRTEGALVFEVDRSLPLSPPSPRKTPGRGRARIDF